MWPKNSEGEEESLEMKIGPVLIELDLNLYFLSNWSCNGSSLWYLRFPELL